MRKLCVMVCSFSNEKQFENFNNVVKSTKLPVELAPTYYTNSTVICGDIETLQEFRQNLLNFNNEPQSLSIFKAVTYNKDFDYEDWTIPVSINSVFKEHESLKPDTIIFSRNLRDYLLLYTETRDIDLDEVVNIIDK